MILSDGSEILSSLDRTAAMTCAAVIVIGLATLPFIGTAVPLFLPLLAAFLSIGIVLGARPRDPGVSTMFRAGFHCGTFAYLLAYPILAAGELDPGIGAGSHEAAGIALVLSVAGFEIAYWLGARPAQRFVAPDPPILTQRRRLLLVVLVWVGLTSWFLAVADIAISYDVPLSAVMFTMRGQFARPYDDVDVMSYVRWLLGAGTFLSATAGAILLTGRVRITRLETGLCWACLLLCASVGFMNGSRATFLFSFVPIAVTVWQRLIDLGSSSAVRRGAVVAGAALILVGWSVMSNVRGRDLREVVSVESAPLARHARDAFDMYSPLTSIIDAFPAAIEFEMGRSLVPLVLGWVPRMIWPEKPYAFGLHATHLNGESLERRTASLAVGVTAEGYGNFGLMGVALWCAALGAACRRGDEALSRMTAFPVTRLQLGAFGAVWVAMLVRGGVPEMFYMGLRVIIFPMLLARLIASDPATPVRPVGATRAARKPVVTRALSA